MINFLVALPAEARPLVEHLKLSAVPDTPFKLYAGARHRLLVSGVGQMAMAAACGWLAGRAVGTTDAWLNVGVAGHRSLAVGELRLAHRISDATLDRRWYPPQLVGELDSDDLTTVARPLADYPWPGLVDMEASAFVAACARFCTAELVQSVKVVSDNPRQPLAQLDAKKATELLAAKVVQIADYAQALDELGRSYRDGGESPALAAIAGQWQARWRFSVTRQHQLRRLLQRWLTLAGETRELDIDAFEDCRDAAAVIDRLRREVEQLPVRLAP